MSDINKTLRLNELYDFYKELLTDKQKLYFEDYYFNDLSLKEIADKYNVSRNAVHLSIKDAESDLEKYETKLSLLEKFHKREELYIKLESINDEKIIDIVNKLKEIE